MSCDCTRQTPRQAAKQTHTVPHNQLLTCRQISHCINYTRLPWDILILRVRKSCAWLGGHVSRCTDMRPNGLGLQCRPHDLREGDP